MNDIFVLGAGTAGISFIKRIRDKNYTNRLTLIDKMPQYFNKSELISHLDFRNRVDLKQWAQENNIEFIQDTVERVNPGRRKIYLKNSQARDFGTLIVSTGVKSKKTAVKGDHRDGFFYLSEINCLKLKDLLRISREATIYISGVLGLEFILPLYILNKELKVIGNKWDFLGVHRERTMEIFKEKNIAVYYDVILEEAIGEGIVRAVKISPLKIFSSQLVFIDSGFEPALDFFEEKVFIKDKFLSDYEDVYFLGDVNRNDIEDNPFFQYNYEDVRQQAIALADFLLEKNLPVWERKDSTSQEYNKITEVILNRLADIKQNVIA